MDKLAAEQAALKKKREEEEARRRKAEQEAAAARAAAEAAARAAAEQKRLEEEAARRQQQEAAAAAAAKAQQPADVRPALCFPGPRRLLCVWTRQTCGARRGLTGGALVRCRVCGFLQASKGKDGQAGAAAAGSKASWQWLRVTVRL